MLTVLETINKSTEYLAKKGIDSARTNAELLLADILHCKRLDLYLMYDRPLTEDELAKFREHLKRRGTFEPVQYIIGSVEFYGLKLKVSSSVLIPRPETEILVETIINSAKMQEGLNILDIGTGSGNISIALATHLLNDRITGIDVSEDAITIARENVIEHKLNERIKLIRGDIFDMNLSEISTYDIIVSNPPYVSKKEYSGVQEEIKHYEPEIAVTDFSSGLKFYERIITLSSKLLNTPGKLFFELGQGQSEKVKDLLIKNSFKEVSVIKDYQNIDRVIYGVKS